MLSSAPPTSPPHTASPLFADSTDRTGSTAVSATELAAASAVIDGGRGDGLDVGTFRGVCAVLTCADDGAQLLAPTAVANAPRRIAQGCVGELVARGDTAGAGVVAPIRPDLVVVDLDGCAEVVLPRLLDAAAEVAAEVVHVAASGSADSVHAIFAARCAAGQVALLDAVDRLREWAGCDARAVDVVDGGRGLRLPGSVSFKPGGAVCVPIDVDGNPLTPAAAVSRARTALRAVGLPPTYQNGHPTPGRRRTAVVSRDSRLPATADGVRAWRRRTPLTDADQAVLDRSPQRGERSEAACAGAWVLWCHGIRDWAEADTFYDRPVFAKYRTRADGGRAHWERQASQWASYRAPVTPTDQSVIDGWLAAGANWTDGTAQATLVAVLQTFSDGRGLVARPIGCRDLAPILGCSTATAARRLHLLRDRGVVEVARQWQDGPTQEATRYTLSPAPAATDEPTVSVYRGVLTQDTDTPTGHPPPVPLTPALLHPTWAALGHTCRRLWELLARRLPTAALQSLTGLARGDTSHGLLHHLHDLAAAGLIRRTGTGRATTWERTPSSLDTAADQLGVTTRTHTLAQVITAERAVWHAESAPDRTRAATRLAALRHHLRTRPLRVTSTTHPAADDLDAELAALVDDTPPPAGGPGNARAHRLPAHHLASTTLMDGPRGTLLVSAVQRLVQTRIPTTRQPRRTTTTAARPDDADPG